MGLKEKRERYKATDGEIKLFGKKLTEVREAEVIVRPFDYGKIKDKDFQELKAEFLRLKTRVEEIDAMQKITFEQVIEELKELPEQSSMVAQFLEFIEGQEGKYSKSNNNRYLRIAYLYHHALQLLGHLP